MDLKHIIYKRNSRLIKYEDIGGLGYIEKLRKPGSRIGLGTKIFLVMSLRNSKSFQSSKLYILLADIKGSMLAAVAI